MRQHLFSSKGKAMQEVIMYWDIDGCLNSFSRRPPKTMTKWEGDWAEQRVETLDGDSWRILWSKELVEAVNVLSALPHVTMKWLTTWQDSAPAFIAPALHIDGAEAWEVVHIKDPAMLHTYAKKWWKLDVLQEDVAKNPDAKFVWIDDDIKSDLESILWMRNIIGEIGLMISPSSYLGVTKNEIDDIMEFIGKS